MLRHVLLFYFHYHAILKCYPVSHLSTGIFSLKSLLKSGVHSILYKPLNHSPFPENFYYVDFKKHKETVEIYWS